MALEPEFWAVLEDMAKSEGLSMAGLIAKVDQGRGESPLASACRVTALAYAGQR
jgi:predicted DNA-binding ribbon-helix-helix protein